MPNQILQVDENMLETKLDRLVSEKVEQLLNAMLDAEADEITGACRRSYTLECKTNAVVSCYKIKNKGICRFYSSYTIASTFSQLSRSALTRFCIWLSASMHFVRNSSRLP